MCSSEKRPLTSPVGCKVCSCNLIFITHLSFPPSDLERAAFVFAVVCIMSSVASVAGGAYGSLAHERYPIVTASAAALVSGNRLMSINHSKQLPEQIDGSAADNLRYYSVS